MKKRFLCLFVVIISLFALSGCSGCHGEVKTYQGINYYLDNCYYELVNNDSSFYNDLPLRNELKYLNCEAKEFYIFNGYGTFDEHAITVVLDIDASANYEESKAYLENKYKYHFLICYDYDCEYAKADPEKFTANIGKYFCQVVKWNNTKYFDIFTLLCYNDENKEIRVLAFEDTESKGDAESLKEFADKYLYDSENNTSIRCNCPWTN